MIDYKKLHEIANKKYPMMSGGYFDGEIIDSNEDARHAYIQGYEDAKASLTPKHTNKFRIKDAFVCEFCRNICDANCSELLDQIAAGKVTDENKDLIGRKHKIKCLGRFCETPCEYQDLTAYENVDLTPFIDLIKFLGNKCNDLLIEDE